MLMLIKATFSADYGPILIRLQRGRSREREQGSRGASYLLLDVDLRQALEFGGVLRDI